MSDLKKQLELYMTEVDMKASRSEQALAEPVIAASTYLAAVHSTDDGEIDGTITQHNRNFPHGQNWQQHLISLSKQFQDCVRGRNQLFYEYDRCSATALQGVKMFDHLRTTRTTIRSIAEFRKAFDMFGGTVLNDLNWENIGVAGGCMLACLTQLNFGRDLRNSDIDLFIWGLSAAGMEKKLQHVKATIEANVEDFAAKYVVERSVGAITFVPKRRAAGRKVQVVLRGYANPAAVLAGFDIDPACIFYDGEEVWLSLRAVRALYTGYTTTSGSISSSFAARIVKYATRGYGVLVRPDEDEPSKTDLLRVMETTLRDEERKVLAYFSRLPWTGSKKFKRVFTVTKSSAPNNWTHSYSAFASLAALWHLAHLTGRIGELMDEVGAASNIYGLYEGSDAMMGCVEPEDWLRSLETFSPSLKKRRWALPDHIWKARDADMTKKPLVLVVILPLLLRRYLRTLDGDYTNLDRMPDTDDIGDADDIKLEICLWALTGDKIWQQPDGQESSVHQLLVTAAMLSAWTVWKISSGAPWMKMHYGRSLYSALEYSFNAALTRIGDFEDWIRT
ncbi:hypothetical protein CF326_g6080 [Tilletia indica]|nr:hypothetical protein CF326_g6080 [Tilletia indica]